ncbi:MAG: YIP1 family protein [Oscillospiraceae bacterium]|jgi:hypothetical protein|nr:YIP1 family protein [Oscillospiraceae bacterium]
MSKYFNKEIFFYFRRVLTNPIDSFYEIRHREKGSVPLAFLTILVFSICFTMNRIFAGFIVNLVDPRTINGIDDLTRVILLYVLFCIGNWSVTCLSEGEGRFKDILTVTGYALIPLIITYIPAILLSNVLGQNEDIFYSIILGVGFAWSGILILLGIMTIHNYTMLKTIATLAITIVAMLIVIFLAMLLFDMLNQVYGLFYGIYSELTLRS